jgi:hypothetical protein
MMSKTDRWILRVICWSDYGAMQLNEKNRGKI